MWEAPVIRAQQRTRNDFRRRIRRTSPPSGTGGPARPRTPSPYRSRRRAEQPARSPDRSEGCRSGRGRRPRSGLPRIRAPGSAGSRRVSPGMCITTLSPRPMRKRSARPVMVMAARISAVSPRRASSARSTSSRASRDSSLPAVRARGARHSSSARRTTASGRARVPRARARESRQQGASGSAHSPVSLYQRRLCCAEGEERGGYRRALLPDSG